MKKLGSKKSVKSASIYDVAREARVSVFTVSAVVNHKSHVREKLRKRVETAIRVLNYRPNLIARSLWLPRYLAFQPPVQALPWFGPAGVSPRDGRALNNPVHSTPRNWALPSKTSSRRWDSR